MVKKRSPKIHQFELKAIHMSLLFFHQFLKNQHVQILSDNVTAVLYLSKQGGMRRKTLMELARQILTWAMTNLASLSAVHLGKGMQTLLVDFLSRKGVTKSEWVLNQEVFLMITEAWGLPQMDLFTSQENAKTPAFFSLHKEDLAPRLDTLAHRWCYPLMNFPHYS